MGVFFSVKYSGVIVMKTKIVKRNLNDSLQFRAFLIRSVILAVKMFIKHSVL